MHRVCAIVPVNYNLSEPSRERECTPLGRLAFTSFWCLLKLTNRLHYGKKNNESEAQEALYDFLSVELPKYWDVGLLFSVGETQREKKKDPLSSKAQRQIHFNWNGRPANPLWKSKPPMEASECNLWWTDFPRKKTQSQNNECAIWGPSIWLSNQSAEISPCRHCIKAVSFLKLWHQVKKTQC